MSHVGTSVWQCFSIDFMGDGRIQSAEITIHGSGSRYDDVAVVPLPKREMAGAVIFVTKSQNNIMVAFSSRTPATTGYSFSSGGLLFPYHLGAITSLEYHGRITDPIHLAGASAGAIAVASHASARPGSAAGLSGSCYPC